MDIRAHITFPNEQISLIRSKSSLQKAERAHAEDSYGMDPGKRAYLRGQKMIENFEELLQSIQNSGNGDY